jgi:hypothetical protein
MPVTPQELYRDIDAFMDDDDNVGDGFFNVLVPNMDSNPLQPSSRNSVNVKGTALGRMSQRMSRRTSQIKSSRKSQRNSLFRVAGGVASRQSQIYNPDLEDFLDGSNSDPQSPQTSGYRKETAEFQPLLRDDGSPVPFNERKPTGGARTSEFQPLLRRDGSPVPITALKPTVDARTSEFPALFIEDGSYVPINSHAENHYVDANPEGGGFGSLADISPCDENHQTTTDQEQPLAARSDDRTVQFNNEDEEEPNNLSQFEGAHAVYHPTPIRRKDTAVNFFSNWRDCLEVSDHSESLLQSRHRSHEVPSVGAWVCGCVWLANHEGASASVVILGAMQFCRF